MRTLLKAVATSLVLILAQQNALHADTGNMGTEFLDAAFRGRTETVKNLLAKGADPNSRDDIGQTALMGAARNGHVQTVKVLLEAGADVNVKLHATNWTALLLAAFYGHAKVVETLLSHGADPKVKDSEGKTALTWAKTKAHRQVVLVLEKAGVTE